MNTITEEHQALPEEILTRKQVLLSSIYIYSEKNEDSVIVTVVVVVVVVGGSKDIVIYLSFQMLPYFLSLGKLRFSGGGPRRGHYRSTVEPVYNGHPRDVRNWPLNTGSLI